MNKDQIIAELFFSFRIAKRLLEIDHPTCDYFAESFPESMKSLNPTRICGKSSVGCKAAYPSIAKKMVVGYCEEHRPTTNDPLQWSVRWDYLENAENIRAEDDETPAE